MAMDNEILKVLQEMSKKLDDAKDGGVGGPSTKIEEGDDEATIKRKKAAQKLEQDAAARKAKLKAEEIRLETQLNINLFERQAAMDGLLKLEGALGDLEEQRRLAFNDGNDEAVAGLDEEIERTEKLLNANRSLTEQAQKQTEAQKQARKAGDDLFRGLAGTIGLAKRAQDTYAGKLFKMVNVLREPGGGTAFFKGIGQAILQLPLAILDSIIQHTIQMIFALDNAQNAFSAVTQQGEKYNQMISNATFANVEFGISAEETGKAAQGMYDNFFAFTQVSEEGQKSMINFASRMEKLGVSTEQTANMMNFFNKNLGQTSAEAQESAAQMALLGRNIGIGAQRMSRDFLAAMPKLAVYGSRATEIFGNIAAAAQRSGTSVSSLLDLAGKFDTFQSAAETVGKLNAILGSQMSATEMLMMTEDERIETLILQVQASGMAFRDMDRFTQKAIAAAAGISDMNEAQRIFGMSLGSYREAQHLMKKEADAQEKVDAAVKAALPAKQKLLIAFNQMVSQYITDAFIERMHQFVDWLINLTKPGRWTAWLKEMGLTKEQIWATTKKWGQYALAFYAAIKLIPAFIGGLMKMRMAQKTQMVTQKMSNVQMVAAAKNLRAQGMAAAGAALKFAAIGAAILMAGYGIKIATEGFATLATAMGEMKANAVPLVLIIFALTGAFVAMTFALVGMTAASAPSAPILLAVGAALFLMGAGIGIAALGMSKLVESFKGIGIEGAIAMGVMSLSAVALAFVALALVKTSVGTAMLGAASLSAAPGLAVFAAIIGGITLALVIVIGTMTRMFNSMAKFGKAIKGTAADSRAMADAIWDVAHAATYAGNPLSLLGLRSMTKYAQAQRTEVKIGGAGLKALADSIGDTGEAASSFNDVANSMSAIASGVRDLDTAIGSGKRRVEITSTLASLAKISTAEVGSSVFNKQAASTKAAQQTMKYEIKNEFKDLQLVIKDAGPLDAYIVGVMEKYGRYGNA